MANAEFQCPHCKNAIKAIPVKGLSSTAPSLNGDSAPLPFEIDETPSARVRSRRGFWASLTGTYIAAALLAGLVMWLYTWSQDYNPIIAVFVFLLAIFGLPAFELVLHRPARKPKPREQRHNIHVKMTSEDGRDTYLDHFKDKSIQMQKIIVLAKLVEANELEWLGRPTVCGQTKQNPTRLKITQGRLPQDNPRIRLSGLSEGRRQEQP